MLKYCRDKWEENKDKLEKALREADNLNGCDYKELVVMVVEYILNPSEDDYDAYDSKNITVIDNGRGIPVDIQKKAGNSGRKTKLMIQQKRKTEGAALSQPCGGMDLGESKRDDGRSKQH